MISAPVIYLIFGILLLMILYEEHDRCLYMIRTALRPSEEEAIPTPTALIRKVKQSIELIPDISSYTFVEFGCGEGDVIQEIHPLVKQTIGIELDKKIAHKAQIRFLRYPKVNVYQKNMTQHTFTDEPTLLYAYEPLWKVTDLHEEKSVYDTVFQNLQKVTKPVYVIYISGTQKQALDSEFFKKYHLKVIRHEAIPRFMFFRNQFYILKMER